MRILYILLIFLLAISTINAQEVKLCVWEAFAHFNQTIKAHFDAIKSDQNIQLTFIKPDSDVNAIERISSTDCDIAMTDALWVQEYPNNLIPLDSSVENIINERVSSDDPKGIYNDLIDDITYITKDNEKKIYGLPYLLDFGVLYYNTRKVTTTPTTWDELFSISESIGGSSFDKVTKYSGQYNEYRGFYYNFSELTANFSDEDDLTLYGEEGKSAAKLVSDLFGKEVTSAKAWTQDARLLIGSFCKGEIIFMRNWSSYENLINICEQEVQYSKTVMPKGSSRKGDSRTLVKGIYISIIKKKQSYPIDFLTQVIGDITSKNFMNSIIKDPVFSDITPYIDLISTSVGTEYCSRINCDFYTTILKNIYTKPVARYSRTEEGITNEKFISTVKESYNSEKGLFNRKEDVSEEMIEIMSNYYENKYIKWTDMSAIIIGGISAIGAIITIAVFVVVIKNRSALVIRRSSPLFLYFMLFGILIAFGSVFTYIGRPNEIICTIRPIVIVLAFGLAFLALFIKTFRIKVIFDKSDIKVQDKYLLIYSGCILFIELIIVGLWTYLDRMQPRVTYLSANMHYYTCTNTGKLGKYFQLSLLVINAIILLYGCYLAIKVKDVYSDYNESKVIGLSIYGIMICMIIQLIISACASLGHSVIFIIQSLMIILSSTILLTFMFIPKFWKLHMTGSSQNQSSQPSSQRPSNANNQNNSYSTKSEKNGYINMQNVENEYYNNMAQQRNNYYNMNGSSESLNYNNNNYYNNNNNYNNNYNNSNSNSNSFNYRNNMSPDAYVQYNY